MTCLILPICLGVSRRAGVILGAGIACELGSGHKDWLSIQGSMPCSYFTTGYVTLKAAAGIAPGMGMNPAPGFVRSDYFCQDLTGSS